MKPTVVQAIARTNVVAAARHVETIVSSSVTNRKANSVLRVTERISFAAAISAARIARASARTSAGVGSMLLDKPGEPAVIYRSIPRHNDLISETPRRRLRSHWRLPCRVLWEPTTVRNIRNQRALRKKPSTAAISIGHHAAVRQVVHRLPVESAQSRRDDARAAAC